MSGTCQVFDGMNEYIKDYNGSWCIVSSKQYFTDKLENDFSELGVNLIIVDEAHEMVTDQSYKILSKFGKNIFTIFMSGTPDKVIYRYPAMKYMKIDFSFVELMQKVNNPEVYKVVKKDYPHYIPMIESRGKEIVENDYKVYPRLVNHCNYLTEESLINQNTLKDKFGIVDGETNLAFKVHNGKLINKDTFDFYMKLLVGEKIKGAIDPKSSLGNIFRESQIKNNFHCFTKGKVMMLFIPPVNIKLVGDRIKKFLYGYEYIKKCVKIVVTSTDSTDTKNGSFEAICDVERKKAEKVGKALWIITGVQGSTGFTNVNLRFVVF